MTYKLKALPILEDVDDECEPFDICIDIDLGIDHDGDSVHVASKSPSPSSTRKFCELLDAHKALVLSLSPADPRQEQHSSHLSVQDFGNLVVGLNLTYYPYIGGAAPRTVIPVTASSLPVVFTANESPPDQPIRT